MSEIKLRTRKRFGEVEVPPPPKPLPVKRYMFIDQHLIVPLVIRLSDYVSSSLTKNNLFYLIGGFDLLMLSTFAYQKLWATSFFIFGSLILRNLSTYMYQSPRASSLEAIEMFGCISFFLLISLVNLGFIYMFVFSYLVYMSMFRLGIRKLDLPGNNEKRAKDLFDVLFEVGYSVWEKILYDHVSTYDPKCFEMVEPFTSTNIVFTIILLLVL